VEGGGEAIGIEAERDITFSTRAATVGVGGLQSVSYASARSLPQHPGHVGKDQASRFWLLCGSGSNASEVALGRYAAGEVESQWGAQQAFDVCLRQGRAKMNSMSQRRRGSNWQLGAEGWNSNLRCRALLSLCANRRDRIRIVGHRAIQRRRCKQAATAGLQFLFERCEYTRAPVAGGNNTVRFGVRPRECDAQRGVLRLRVKARTDRNHRRWLTGWQEVECENGRPACKRCQRQRRLRLESRANDDVGSFLSGHAQRFPRSPSHPCRTR